jgi:hypothetical protein
MLLLKRIVLIVLGLCAMTYASSASDPTQEKMHAIAMRMMGHQLLLDIGDSTSLVLPVEKVGERYRITFETPFAFEPSVLVESFKTASSNARLNHDYLVEVERCDSAVVVYSYKQSEQEDTDIIPCGGRPQPEACYTVFVTLLGESNLGPLANSAIDYPSEKVDQDGDKILSTVTLYGGPVLLLLTLLFANRKIENEKDNAEKMKVGQYDFDPVKMRLVLNEKEIELSSKENELLRLFIQHKNKTVTREDLLHTVWGDEGDYVGRTLDVFVSKLRKKLEGDPNLKIVNVRGVGYRLVVS